MVKKDNEKIVGHSRTAHGRQERLALALRENLKRRKTLVRERRPKPSQRRDGLDKEPMG
jgi:hypothetical protein